MMSPRQSLLANAAVLLALLAPAARGAGPAAPLYPGTVPDSHAGDVTVRVYLSHDAPAKVTAWYAKRVGALTAADGNTLWNADSADTLSGRPLGAVDVDATVERVGRVTMDQSTVVRALKDMTMTKDIGVFCEFMVRKPAQAEQSGSSGQSANGESGGAGSQQLEQMRQQLAEANRQLLASVSPEDRKIGRMSDLFEGLREEVAGEQHGHTKQDLIAVYEKYKHLETAWYPTVKTADGLESYDRWLLARDKARLNAKRQKAAAPTVAASADMSALAARIQAAAAAGRMDEVRALGARMRGAMATQQGASNRAKAVVLADHWDYWLAFLKDLDAHAYRTRIWINTAPASWGY
ncbi:MAG: hypothetical protein P8076_11050 [Gammaproteobacteria bacterium]